MTIVEQSPKRREQIRLLIGLFSGIILPIVGAIVVIWIRWGHDYQYELYKTILFEPKMLAFVMTIGLFINLPVFYFFNWKKRVNSAKGVVLATCLWALFLMLYVWLS